MNKSKQWKREKHTARTKRKQAKVRAQHRSGKGKREPQTMPPVPRRIAREARKAS